VRQSMKLLAIDTATESCSASLMLGDEMFHVTENAPRRHNEIILSMCEEVLAQGQTVLSQLDAIAFDRGPGAFTGVRLAASVAQGIAFGQDLPVIPVSSLAALAQAVYEKEKKTHVLSCIDARMQEVYYALYELGDLGIMELVGMERVISPEKVESSFSGEYFGVGSGWQTYSEKLHASLGAQVPYEENVFPQAEQIASLAKVYYAQGKSVPAIEALPVYLRDNVAEKPKKKVVF